MYKNILVALDGSNLSEAALVPAAYLAQKLGARVTLLHVIEQAAPAEAHRERHLTQPDEAVAYLEQVARRAFPAQVRVDTHVHSAPVTDVARSIVEHASREFQPDLIVCCTHGHGGLRDVLYGSIAQQIVTHGTTPLLLVKPGLSSFKLEVVLIPLDPDSVHDYSLLMAEPFARAFDARLHLLSVIPTLSTLNDEQAAAGNLMPVAASAILDLNEENARQDLQTHLDKFHRAGLQASSETVRGEPVAAILKSTDDFCADMIILSTHRKAGLRAFWARSVAPKVAQKTSVPLLLIPLT